MKRVVGLSVLSLLLAGGLLFLRRGSSGTDHAGVSPGVAAEESSAPGGAPEGGVLQQPPDPTVSTRGSDPATSTARSELQPSTGANGGILVRIVTEDGQPLPAVTARVIFGATPRQRSEYEDLATVDALFAGQGVELQSDAQGFLRLEARDLKQIVLVAARQGDLWGRARFRSRAGLDVDLPLTTDQRLLVRVVNSSGVGVGGVPVQLKLGGAVKRSAIASANSIGPEGLATFAHVQVILQPSTDQFRVQLDVLSVERISESLDPTALPSSPIELLLPDSGSVALVVLDEEGRGYGGEGTARLLCLPAGSSHDISPFSHLALRETSVPIHDGGASFPFVEVGSEVRASVTRSGFNVESRKFASGPLLPGERVDIQLQFGLEHPVIRARAVRGDGTVMASQALDVALDSRTGPIGYSLTAIHSTDEDGYFLIDLPTSPGGEGHVLVAVTPVGPESVLQSRAEFSNSLESGLHDIGDLLFLQPTAFVKGRVISSTGASIGRAALSLRAKSGVESTWRELYRFTGKSDTEGAFDFAKDQAGVEFQMAAARPGYSSYWTSFQRGETDLRIVMEREATISGTVLLPEGVSPGLIQLRLRKKRQRSEDDAFLPLRSSSTVPDTDGQFKFSRLTGGVEFTVEVSPQRQSRKLRSITEVLVTSGEDSADPRLNPIDLRESIFLHRIELVADEELQSVSGAIRYREVGGGEFDDRQWLREPSFSLLTVAPVVDLSISVNGYRDELVENVSGAARVQLRPAIEVTLVLAGGADLPKAPVYLKAVLVEPDAEQPQVSYAGPAFDKDRQIRTLVSAPGQRRVLWLGEKRSMSSSMAMQLSLERSQLVDVLDVDGEQRIEVRLSAEEMAELISQI